MLFENQINTIKDYPELFKVYLEKLAENYRLKSIHMHALEPDVMDISIIELGMENMKEELILITYVQHEESITIEIKQRSEESMKGSIHPNLNLSVDRFNNTKFKKQLIGGYNKKQIDDLRNWLLKDYTFIEKVLIRQNKMLKDDIEKLRN